MKRADTFKDELTEIRIRLYEETKNMTIKEHVAYINSLAAPIIKQHGLKTLNSDKN